MYYAVIQEGGEDPGGGSVVGVEAVAVAVGGFGEALEGGHKVGSRRAGCGLEGAFGEGVSIEDGLNGGGVGCGDNPGVQGSCSYLVEGETRAVGGCERVIGVRYRVQMAGSNAGLQDQVPVGFRDAVAVVYHRQGPVAFGPQG